MGSNLNTNGLRGGAGNLFSITIRWMVLRQRLDTYPILIKNHNPQAIEPVLKLLKFRGLPRSVTGRDSREKEIEFVSVVSIFDLHLSEVYDWIIF